MIPDGLYQIRGKNLTAGFEVRGGRITACAPILRKLLFGPEKDKWLAKAKHVFSLDLNEPAIEAHPNETQKKNEKASSRYRQKLLGL